MPETPGWYWCKFVEEADWTVAEVVRSPYGHLLVCSATFEGLVRYVAEWGARIPGPARLAALEELAAESPAEFDDWDRPFCRHCDVALDKYDHLNNCRWQRAQEERDADPE